MISRPIDLAGTTVDIATSDGTTWASVDVFDVWARPDGKPIALIITEHDDRQHVIPWHAITSLEVKR